MVVVLLLLLLLLLWRCWLVLIDHQTWPDRAYRTSTTLNSSLPPSRTFPLPRRFYWFMSPDVSERETDHQTTGPDHVFLHRTGVVYLPFHHHRIATVVKGRGTAGNGLRLSPFQSLADSNTHTHLSELVYR
uniref:Putative secreted protein n=1 Tax=Anopheles darlingi TaxID=43151 RepID=A0A2M4D4S2_ANODA